MRIKNINITGLALFQKGINIDLARVNAIIGDNASGKTYLLNVIAFILIFLMENQSMILKQKLF